MNAGKNEKIMKTLLIATLVSISTLAFGQAEAFFKAVEKQDIASITNLLMDEVELCIKDDQRILSKAATTKAIKEFLSKVKPKSVASLHSGSSGASKYKVAKMMTNSGMYRIFVYLEGDKIQEVRFDTF